MNEEKTKISLSLKSIKNGIKNEIEDLKDISETKIETPYFQRKTCFSKLYSCIFCCKCLSKYFPTNDKSYFINVWNSLSKEYRDKRNAFLPFQVLINLYLGKKDIINDLKKIRLNPNLLLVNSGQRNDLEFYIPQLINYNFFGTYEQITKLFWFLCNVCYSSFFFAHRIYWFLRSFSFDTEMNIIEKETNIMNVLFKSENKNIRHIVTNLFITGSQRYINYLKSKNLLFLYENIFEEIELNKLDDEQLIYYDKIKENKDIIYNYCDKMLLKELKKNKNNNKIEDEENIKQIDINNIFINNYFYYSESPIDCNDERIKNEIIVDNNFKSFYSVISFYDDLCNISEELINQNPINYKEILIRKITEINKNLPANIYIPFLTDSSRNYILIHIPISEIKLYKTKERVPFMLVFEMIRLDEILFEIYKKQMDKNLFFENYQNVNKRKNASLFNKLKKINLKKNKKKKISIDEDKNEQIKNIIDEIDLEMSKPISIFSIEKTQVIMDNKIYNNENQELNEDKINSENKKINLKFVNDIDNKNKNLITESQFNEKYNKINDILESESETESENIINTNLKINVNLINNSKEQKISSPLSPLSPNYEPNKNLIKTKNINNNYNTFSFDIKRKYSDDNYHPSDIIETEEDDKNLNQNLKNPNIKSIFGESIYTQTERLKNNSPFKNFKTFKLFKVLIKTGENLQQEQFATQLISEFKNIFTLNKVDIWLSSYEVLSTGIDRGLIEIVPNSLSLDEIKQKTGLSLKDFYISYFGEKKSKKYKQAIKNYIKSLAGYSLVCYFLQIKDRHNGNLLIDSQGHIIHIDFGFMLSNSPGKGLKFENAPFKITDEMLELLGGVNSKYFEEYRKRLIKGYFAIYNNYDKILKLNEFMFNGAGREFPCFEDGEDTIIELKKRLIPKEKMRNKEKMEYIDNLISQSIDNWTTNVYDKFQYYIQGIFY